MENEEPRPLLVSFIASGQGAWRIERIDTIVGESLPAADRLEVVESPSPSLSVAPAWVLRGVTSNVRYTNRLELDALQQSQEPLNRPLATRAALIPIRKTAAWWNLAQDERRRIFEEQSHHIAIGLEYLPAIARRLHHSRELHEPFDFLTWFEYVPEHSDAFEHTGGTVILSIEHELTGGSRKTAEFCGETQQAVPAPSSGAGGCRSIASGFCC